MSAGVPCSCKPKNRARWRVTQRRCNHSAFNGYHHTHSDYSAVQCLDCSGSWRTKAAYVDKIATMSEGESNA